MSGIKKNIHGAVYRRMICEVIWVLVGNLMMAFGVAAFISPLGFICGGATGIGRALQYWFHIPLSGALGLLNIISWIIGLLFLGKKLAAGTLLSSFFQPVFLEIFLHLMQQVTWTQDMLLAAIIAGGINGAGLGIVMRAGASTGGLDIPALMGEKYLHIPLGDCALFLNIFSLLLQIPFSETEQILCGVVNTILMSMAMNYVLLYGQKKAQVLIITPAYERLRHLLLAHELGVTLFEIETGMEGIRQKALLCAVPLRKTAEVKKLTAEVDPAAFIVIQTGAEIRGRGFSFPRYAEGPSNNN